MTTVPRRKSVTKGQHTFAQIPQVQIPRSAFDRSCGTKTTFDAGDLVPIFTDEALPGDTINLRTTIFCRLATLINPIMDNIMLDVFWFFVPNRLLWDNWEKFNGAQTDPGDSTDYTVPIVTTPAGGYAEESLWDYLGLPPGVDDLDQSALFSRAYNLIYNEWFRDQNLQDSVVVDTDDGPDTDTDYVILKRGKRHDYFTSCLPWTQKGDSVSLPLGTSAPLSYGAEAVVGDATPAYPTFNVGATTANLLRGDGSTTDARWATTTSTTSNAAWNDPALEVDLTGGTADLSSATAATINQIRQAFQMQKLLERDARGGTRYVEVLKAHFGVTSPDARLQRPEFLGGQTIPVIQTQIASTNQLGGLAVGDLGSFGTAASQDSGFVHSFTEHGVILGLIAARADLNYQQGVPRHFSRSTRYDFYWPALAHIGEQSVLNKEIYAQGTSADDEVFGYQERYAEYRYKPSQITGEMRSSHSATLENWHLAQDFASLPTLNSTFIQETPPIDRVLFVQSDAPQFLLDAHFSYRHVRPMPTYGVPGYIDHF